MNRDLAIQTYQMHLNNLEHCKNFKQEHLKLTTQTKQTWIGKDVARLPALYFYAKYVKQFSLQSKKLLTFGGINDYESKILPHKEWFDCDYWIDNKLDVEDLTNSNLDKDYDFCLINQTFEHLTDINKAIKNISNHLLPGGYLYCNFPVINIPHGEPFMFFTGVAVQLVIYNCLQNNFKVQISGQWGNKNYIDYIYEKLTWPDYTQIVLDNDIKRPCIGWVLAQKL